MTAKARTQEAEPDPFRSNVEGNSSNASSQATSRTGVEHLQDTNEQLSAKAGKPATLRSRRDGTRVLGIPPPVGHIIEVVWEISPDYSDEEDDEWQLLRENNTQSRVWWPAKVLEGTEDHSRSLQYTRSAESRNHLDLDFEVHTGILFYSNGELQHSCGRFVNMFGEWRFCAWNWMRDSQSDVNPSCDGVFERDVGHDECRSALLQLSGRVKFVERKLESLNSIASGLSQLHPAVTAEFKLQVVVDRIKAMLRTHIFAVLEPTCASAKARRTNTSPYTTFSEHELVKDGTLRCQEVDCTLSEFQHLAMVCHEVCREGIEVRPSFYRTSFLNFRSKESLQIVFKSVNVLCKALGVSGHCIEDLFYHVRSHRAFSPMKVRVAGFSITRKSGDASESVMIPGKGSTWLRSPSSENLTVLYRPLSGWNSRDSCFGSDYQLRTLSVRELQDRYCEAFQTRGGADQRDEEILNKAHKKLSQERTYSARKADYKDFEITIEWKRREGQILSAFSAVSSAQDILGYLVCSIPYIDVATSALCQNIVELLDLMKLSKANTITEN